MSIPPGQRGLWPQLDYIDPDEVQARLGPHNPLLWRLAHDPFNDWMRRREVDPAFHRWEEFDVAQWMHIQMKLRAQLLFGDHPDIRPRRLKSGMFILDCCEKFAITMKKLHIPKGGPSAGEICRSNYMTVANRDYWEQRESHEYPNYPRVILGYMLQQEMTAIRVIVGYPRSRGTELHWFYFLPNEPQTGLWVAPPPTPEDQPKPGFEVFPDEESDEESTGK